MEGVILWGDIMQAHALLSIDRERLRPFFERVPELFESYHHSEQQNSDGYEELLYRVYRPYTREMLDMIDEWMGLEPRNWRIEVEREVMLMLYAIRYPDTLLLESLSDESAIDLQRLSGYLHFMKHTYTIWDEDTRQGLEKLGIMIPKTERADPFIYGAYISAIELLKNLAPFHSFMEHDIPRQRLFQAALAAYGRKE
ncbi:MAG: hypothetical protein QF807_04300 [Candidatus Thalassarchaeaceae archaeon]|nr:hypothetical protein [Candidatus Thalassarchaeaceae archaeon]MDP7043219.1 hypothetical protein [Candidatus Thalassarchaeaceae archaeon]